MSGEKGNPHPESAARSEHQRFFERVLSELDILVESYATNITPDLVFLAFLRVTSQFGFFRYGPITIDTHVVEDIAERTLQRNTVTAESPPTSTPDHNRFSRLLMEEVRRSGRSRIDELHYLLAFMRINEGLPGRVFGELGVTPGEVERYGRTGAIGGGDELERLYSPEEAAKYLGVHVQTVRAWIRSGRLPARRLTGQRALRIRASDLATILEPVDPSEVE